MGGGGRSVILQFHFVMIFLSVFVPTCRGLKVYKIIMTIPSFVEVLKYMRLK